MGWFLGVIGAIIIVLILVFGGITLVGPTIDKVNTERGRGDAQVGKVDNEPRTVYQMPDRFSNVATFCDEFGNAVYSNTRGEANAYILVVKDGCE